MDDLEKSIKSAIKELGAISKSALPQGIRATLNELAFRTKEKAPEAIKKSMIARTPYTTKSGIRIEKARQRNIRDMIAFVGHQSEYMRVQDQGGIERPEGAHWIAQPRARTAQSMTRRVARRFYIQKLTRANTVYTKTGALQRTRRGLQILYNISKKSIVVRPTNWTKTLKKRALTKKNVNNALQKSLKNVLNRYG